MKGENIVNDFTITASFLFSIIAVVGVLSTIWANHKKNQSKQEAREVDIQRNFTSIEIKLDNLNTTLADLRRTSQATSSELRLLSEAIARNDEQIKTLYSRIERLEVAAIE